VEAAKHAALAEGTTQVKRMLAALMAKVRADG
jgi:hypothetical protein